MSVTSQVPYKKYTAAPAATVFATTFRVVLATDLQVSVNGVVVTVGFTLGALGGPVGVDVTFAAPMVGGEIVELQRVIPKSRATDYQQLGDFNAPVVNADFDRTWMSIQEVDAEVKRSIRVPASSTGVNLDLPTPAALTYLRWNALANALESVLLANVSLISLTVYAQTLLSAVDAAAARILLGATTVGSAVFTAASAAAARLSIGAASLGANTFTGLQTFAVGANIASAATINLSTATGNTVHVTGTVATSAVTMNAGQWMLVVADAAWPLTYHATTNQINTGGVNTTLAANDRVLYYFDGTTVYGQIFRASGGGIVSQLRLNTTNGHGSTNITVRRWLNVVENTGGDYTYTDSATLGGFVTTNVDRKWAISYADSVNAAAPFGPTLNSAQLTTAFSGITAANRLAFGYTPAADIPGSAPVTVWLPSGSIVRCQTNGGNGGDPSRATFTMTGVL